MAPSAALPSPVFLPPADVAERLFGVDMWQTPRDILAAVFKPRSRVAVKACHASSKTHTAAIAIALALYEGADVLTTAPTWEQVKTVLWGELHRLLAGSVIPLAEWGAVNQTEIVLADGSHALGLSTNEGVRFQGWHARPGSFLLVIFDEAPGVRPDIYEAVEGISAGGDVRLLLLGNPVIASGPFYDIFASDAAGWDRFTIDAFDTPNLSGLTLPGLLALAESDLDLSARPYLVDRRWVRDRYYEWGLDHPSWQSRVRGQFPLQAEDALLSLAWLEAAKLREPRTPDVTDLVAGIDVGGPGEDETTLAIRRGDDLLHQQAWAQPDPRGAVFGVLRDWADRGLRRVHVDSAGLGYHWFLDLRADLRALGIGVGGINVGRASTVRDRQGNPRFANLKAELYWAFRERAAAGELTGLKDQRTIAQLAGIRYEEDRRGRVEIESKEDARKRGVKSPDRAEAVILAFAPSQSRLGAALAEKMAPTRTPAQRQRLERTDRRLLASSRGRGWA